jgi:hypothetical protein
MSALAQNRQRRVIAFDPISITCRRLRLTGLPQADKSLLSNAE